MTTESKLIAKVMTEGAKKASDDLKSFAGSANEAEGGTRRLTSGLAKLAKSRLFLVGGGVVATFTAIANSVIEAAKQVDDLNDTAQRLGLSFDQLREYQFVFEQYGVGAEEGAEMILKFEKAAYEAARGTGPLRDAIEELSDKVNISASEFEDLSGRDGLVLLAEKMKQANIPMREQAVILDRVAEKSSKLLAGLKNSGKGLNDLADAYREVNEVNKLTDAQINSFGELDEKVNLLSTSFINLKQNVAADFAPAVILAIEGVTTVVNVASRVWNGFVSIVQGGVNFAMALGDAIDGVAESEDAAILIMRDAVLRDKKYSTAETRAQVAKLEKKYAHFGITAASVSGENDGVTKSIGKTGSAAMASTRAVNELNKSIEAALLRGAGAREQIAAKEKEIELNKKVTDSLRSQLEERQSYFREIARIRGGGVFTQEVLDELAAITNQYNEKLALEEKLNSQLSQMKSKLAAEESAIADNRKATNELNANLEFEYKKVMAKNEMELLKITAAEEKRIVDESTMTAEQKAKKKLIIEMQLLQDIKGMNEEAEKAEQAKAKEEADRQQDWLENRRESRKQVFSFDESARQREKSAVNDFYLEQQDNLNVALQQGYITQNEYNDRKLDLHTEFVRRWDEIDAEARNKYITGSADMLNASAGLFESYYERRHAAREAAGKKDTASMVRTWRLAKSFSMSSAILNAYVAATQAFSDPLKMTTEAKFAAYATTISAAMGVVQQAMSVQWTPGRAQGGQFSAGQYLVGEKGPELVRFGGSGRIADANQTAAMMGGGTPSITIVNQTSGRIDTVEQSMDRGQMVLVIKEVMAAETFDPNSKFNRALSKTRTAGRKL